MLKISAILIFDHTEPDLGLNKHTHIFRYPIVGLGLSIGPTCTIALHTV